jgi:hypothetical protein
MRVIPELVQRYDSKHVRPPLDFVGPIHVRTPSPLLFA